MTCNYTQNLLSMCHSALGPFPSPHFDVLKYTVFYEFWYNKVWHPSLISRQEFSSVTSRCDLSVCSHGAYVYCKHIRRARTRFAFESSCVLFLWTLHCEVLWILHISHSNSNLKVIRLKLHDLRWPQFCRLHPLTLVTILCHVLVNVVYKIPPLQKCHLWRTN